LDPYVDTGPPAIHHGLDQSRLGERELLDQKRAFGRIDEFTNRFQAVVGLDNDARR